MPSLPKLAPAGKRASWGCLVGLAAFAFVAISGGDQLVEYLGCARANNQDLYAAVENPDFALVKTLFAQGYDPNSTPPCYWIDIEGCQLVASPKPEPSPVFKAQVGIAGTLMPLMEKGADPNQVGKSGMPPLFEAILRADDNAVAIFLQYRADSNRIGPRGGPPLIQVKNLQALLTAGAQPKLTDVNGKTALFYAAPGSETQVILQMSGAI